MSGYVTQVDIENEIVRLSDELEGATLDFKTQLEESAAATARYRVEYAKSWISHRWPKEGEKANAEKTADQLATRDCGDLLLQRLDAEAQSRYLEERCRNLRAQLDAVRTLSANVRSQT